MKKVYTIIILNLLFNNFFFCQTSTSIKVTHLPSKSIINGESIYNIPNWIPVSTTSSNCFNFLKFTVYVKAKSKHDLNYKIEVTNNSEYDLVMNCTGWGLSGAGRFTVRSRGSYSGVLMTTETYPTIRASGINFIFPDGKQSDYVKCGETGSSILAKEKKKETGNNITKDANNSSSSSSSNSSNKDDENYRNESNPSSSSSNSSNTSNSVSENSQNESHQELSEEEKKQQENYNEKAIEKKYQEREAEAERRREAAKKKNEQIEANTVAMGTLIIALGGIIYRNYGKLGDIYTNNNFLFGIESGFGITIDPEIVTVDLNIKGKFGYERLIKLNSTSVINKIELGANLTPNITLGMFPDLSWQTSYGLGGRFFAGLPKIKLFYDYENGVRTYGIPSQIDNINNTYNSNKYGFKLSFYNKSKILRNHFYIGLIREKISKYGENINGNFEYFTYKGYMFEWYKEHHGRLFFHWIPNYKTDLSYPPQEESPIFVKIGFSRVIESFEPVKRKTRDNETPKTKVKTERKGFLIYTYDKQNSLGGSFGNLRKNKIGYYINLKGGNRDLKNISIKNSSYQNIDINNQGESEESSYHFIPTGKKLGGTDIAISGGITFKLKYPLFAYVGLGIGYFTYAEEVKEFDTYRYYPFNPNGDYNYVWYENTDESGGRFFPEFGLKYKLFNTIVLKYGINIRKGVFSQFGIGFAL